LTAEQLEASRAERMRLNGSGVLTLEDARTWLEETGLCLFVPRKQTAQALAPSFVEAVAGQRSATPDARQIALAEELLVRLEKDDIAVRLNLLGQPGEQPDFIVATWVLPYVYALRGDRDWRRIPQLTGSRQVSPLAVQTYKLLEAGEASIPQLRHKLGREVTEAAVLRAITELWQQLRIIPVIAEPGQTPRWQLLRNRFQKAIAEGASTSQVTAISVLASIYLQAVIAASMEDVEQFLAPLTARSKVREVLRGLVATRQVHTIALGHAPHFYVAGTLPEFAPTPGIYASSAMSGSSYFLHQYGREEEHDHGRDARAGEQDRQSTVRESHVREEVRREETAPEQTASHKQADSHAHRSPAARKPSPASKSSAARPHFSRPAVQARDRKPARASSNGHVSRRPSGESRGTRWSSGGTASVKRNGASSSHRAHSNGSVRSGARKASVPARANHKLAKAAAKPAARKQTVAAGAKAGSGKRYGFAQRTKKRG
jgi:23S rRNA pseudouridine2605 synthase